jgi:hypothetical protein
MCHSSWAAVALVNKSISDTCSVTIPSSVAGNLIAVFCEGTDSRPTNVTDNASGGSNTYTEVVGSRGAFSSGVGETSIWYSQTVRGGATTVTCTPVSDCYGSGANEYSGVLASGNPVDVSSGTVFILCIGGTSCSGAVITTTNAGDVIFTVVGSPYTDFLGGTGNGQATSNYIPGAIVTSSSATWSDSNPGDAVGSSVVAFLPAVAATFGHINNPVWGF